MDKKIFSSKLASIPACLKKRKTRWEIVYYQTNPVTGKRVRHRETWDINRIADAKARKDAAKQAIEAINRMLPHGYPYVSQAEIERKLTNLTLLQAVQKAIDHKLQGDNEETLKDVRSIGGTFKGWIERNKLSGMPVEDFSRRHAHDFLDYVATRKTREGKPISNRTWNNYRNKTGSLFYVLIDREIITSNPFSGIKKKKAAPKHRRKFRKEDRAAIAKWLHEHDYFCFMAVALQYYGLLRGTELRRLRFSDLDLDKGLIWLKATDAKNDKDRWVTLDDQLVQFFRSSKFSGYPEHYIIFGLGGKPHPSKSVGRAYIWRHLKVGLDTLKATGTIKDITGLSPYSFKDTGITEWLECISLTDVMRQAGHSNPRTTMMYFQPDLINTAFQQVGSIFDASMPADRPSAEPTEGQQ